MISVEGAQRMLLALAAGADVDNWYAHKVMSRSTTWFPSDNAAGLPEFLTQKFRSFVACKTAPLQFVLGPNLMARSPLTVTLL